MGLTCTLTVAFRCSISQTLTVVFLYLLLMLLRFPVHYYLLGMYQLVDLITPKIFLKAQFFLCFALFGSVMMSSFIYINTTFDHIKCSHGCYLLKIHEAQVFGIKYLSDAALPTYFMVGLRLRSMKFTFTHQTRK